MTWLRAKPESKDCQTILRSQTSGSPLMLDCAPRPLPCCRLFDCVCVSRPWRHHDLRDLLQVGTNAHTDTNSTCKHREHRDTDGGGTRRTSGNTEKDTIGERAENTKSRGHKRRTQEGGRMMVGCGSVRRRISDSGSTWRARADESPEGDRDEQMLSLMCRARVALPAG